MAYWSRKLLVLSSLGLLWYTCTDDHFGEDADDNRTTSTTSTTTTTTTSDEEPPPLWAQRSRSRSRSPEPVNTGASSSWQIPTTPPQAFQALEEAHQNALPQFMQGLEIDRVGDHEYYSDNEYYEEGDMEVEVVEPVPYQEQIPDYLARQDASFQTRAGRHAILYWILCGLVPNTRLPPSPAFAQLCRWSRLLTPSSAHAGLFHNGNPTIWLLKLLSIHTLTHCAHSHCAYVGMKDMSLTPCDCCGYQFCDTHLADGGRGDPAEHLIICVGCNARWDLAMRTGGGNLISPPPHDDAVDTTHSQPCSRGNMISPPPNDDTEGAEPPPPPSSSSTTTTTLFACDLETEQEQGGSAGT
jgi:hypothetical protein